METKAGIQLTLEEKNLINSLKRLSKRWGKYGDRLWLYSASGTLTVMMQGSTEENPTSHLTRYGGINPENAIDEIPIPNDGGDW